jgi:serine protease Do
MADLMEHGEVQRGLLGIAIDELNSRDAEERGLGMHRGAYVADVSEEGAAASAGIKEGDLITGIDGHVIRHPSELLEVLGRKRPGDEVEVTYYRNGSERTTTATLRNIYGETALVKREEVTTIDHIGARFESVTDAERERLNIEGGVRVAGVERGKLFAEAGIRDGFIITKVDNEPVLSPQELNRKLRNKEGGVLFEGVYPNGRRGYYGVGIK